VVFDIPQGSILGPLLFVIFINDLSAVIDPAQEIIIKYADDTNLLIGDKTVDNLIPKAEILLMNIKEWFAKNKLLLNEEKSNYIFLRQNAPQ